MEARGSGQPKGTIFLNETHRASSGCDAFHLGRWYLQILGAETIGKNFSETFAGLNAGGTGNFNLRLRSGEFGDDLTTETAGPPRSGGFSENKNTSYFLSGIFTECFPDGHSLGTDGAAIARVFNIAAAKDLAIFKFNGRGHPKLTVWGVRVGQVFLGAAQKIL